MSIKWDIKEGDELVVEAVNDDRDHKWHGKLRIIQYRCRVIANLVDFWSKDTDSIMKELGIEERHITRGHANLAMVHIPEVNYLFAVTRKNADHVTVVPSAVDITGEWYAAKNVDAVMHFYMGEIKVTPWMVRKGVDETEFDCINRLVTLVKEKTSVDAHVFCHVGCPKDKSYYFAWLAF